MRSARGPWIIDGGKALRKAIVQDFGATAFVQRCQEHRRRNVLGHAARGGREGLADGLRTIAEGIETTAQHEFVRAMGSCSVQDYLFAPDAGTV